MPVVAADGARRWRPGSCSTATPGSGRGWRSQVHLVNDGPAVSGELRLAGGSQGQTRFGDRRGPADPVGQDVTCCTPSRRRSAASSRSFWRRATRTSPRPRRSSPSTTRPSWWSRSWPSIPRRSSRASHLPPNQNQVAPLVMSVTPEDLPERVEGWNMLDRIVWQDVDADRLTPGQLDRTSRLGRGGGRLVIAGGTAGPKSLAAFPDILLPYRPTTTDGRPGGRPGRHPGRRSRRPRRTCPPCPASWPPDGPWPRSAIASVAAERTYGTGQVTLLGFDPVGRLDRRAEGVGGHVAPAAPAARLRRPRLRRRQHAGQRGLAVALAGPAADRWPDRAAGRLHPADRPDQLPRPAAPRPPRVGVADDAAPDRRLRRRRVRLRGRPARQRRDRQRGRDRRGAPGRDRRVRRRSTWASSRRRAAATRSGVPGGALLSAPDQRHLRRPGRHDDPARRAAGRPGPGPRPGRRASGRCGRSGRRPR